MAIALPLSARARDASGCLEGLPPKTRAPASGKAVCSVPMMCSASKSSTDKHIRKTAPNWQAAQTLRQAPLVPVQAGVQRRDESDSCLAPTVHRPNRTFRAGRYAATAWPGRVWPPWAATPDGQAAGTNARSSRSCSAEGDHAAHRRAGCRCSRLGRLRQVRLDVTAPLTRTTQSAASRDSPRPATRTVNPVSTVTTSLPPA